jgi:hypothetical protein
MSPTDVSDKIVPRVSALIRNGLVGRLAEEKIRDSSVASTSVFDLSSEV